MNSVQLNLSKTQLSKLRNKHPVQIKPSQVGSGHTVNLGSTNFKKLVKAYNNNKSVRITLTNEEIELSGGSFKSFARKAKKALTDKNLGRKISNTSRKIKNSVNKFDVVGDMGIPYVSDGYNALHDVVNSGDAVVQSGVELNRAQRAKEDTGKAREDFVSNFHTLSNNLQSMKGSGVKTNPYIPKSLRKGKENVSKGLKKGKKTVSGGSFLTLGSGMRPSTDESNFVSPNHPSFNPLKPKNLMGDGLQKCPCCGK